MEEKTLRQLRCGQLLRNMHIWGNLEAMFIITNITNDTIELIHLIDASEHSISIIDLTEDYQEVYIDDINGFIGDLIPLLKLRDIITSLKELLND